MEISIFLLLGAEAAEIGEGEQEYSQ